MSTGDKKIKVVFDKAKGMGAFYPEVKLECISLHSNAQVLQSKQDPHINHKDEISATSISGLELAKSFTAMEVDLDLFVFLPVEHQSTYLDIFFNGQISEYLKIGIVQCLNQEMHNSISADPYGFLNPKSGKIKKQEGETIKKYTKYITFPFFQKLPDNITSALEKEDGTADFANLSIQTQLPYEIVVLGTESKPKKNYKIPFKHKEIISAQAGGINTDFLSYFVFTYFDVEAFQTSVSLGTTGYSIDITLTESLEKKLYLGGVSSDIVIKNGSLENKTHAYKYISKTVAAATGQLDQLGELAGTFYSGPVHQMPNGQWMTGKKHGSGTDLPLEKISVPNIKNKDFRQVFDLESFNFDFNQFSDYFTNDEAIINLTSNASKSTKNLFKVVKPNYFSDMYMSRDINGANRFIFSVNMHDVLLRNTMFGDLLMKMFTSNKQKYNQVIKNARIQDFKIKRRRVNRHQLLQSDVMLTSFSKQDFTEMIVFSSDGPSGILSQKEYNPIEDQGKSINYKSQIECTISELKLLNSKTGIRTFTGTDFGVSTKNEGTYQYEVEMKISDPVLPYLRRLNQSFVTLLEGSQSQAVFGWTEYLNDMSMAKFSNRITDRFNFKAYKFYTKKYGSGYIASQVRTFVEALYELGPLSNTTGNTDGLASQMEKYFTFLCNITSPNTGSIDGVILFYNLVNDIHQKLSKVIASANGYVKLKQEPSSADPLTNSPNIVANNKEKTFQIKHTFKDLFSADPPAGHGMDFLSTTLKESTQSARFVGNGLKIYNSKDLLQRFDDETKKIFNIGSDGDLGIEIFSDSPTALSNLVLNPNDTILNKKYSFLSPSVINVVNKKPFLSLKKAISAPPREYSNFFIDLYGTKLRQYGFMNLNTKFKPGSNNTAATQLDVLQSQQETRYDLVRIFADKGCTIERKRFETPKITGETSVDMPNVGSGPFGMTLDSGITNPTLVFGDDTASFEFKDYILDTNVDINGLMSMVLYIDDFKLLNKYSSKIDFNTIDYYYPSKPYGGKAFKDQYQSATQQGFEEPLKSAPNHVKALLLATQAPNKVKDNILKSNINKNQDPFKHRDAFPFILLNYKILNRIEVFRGYGNSGYHVQDPLFTEMTKQDLLKETLFGVNVMLCRQRRYYNSSYGITEMENIDLPILDEYFFLIPETSPDVSQPSALSVAALLQSGLGNIGDPSEPTSEPTPARPLDLPSKLRGDFFETADPNNLIKPEYVQSGLLEDPKLDDGLGDPEPYQQLAIQSNMKTLSSTIGENIQRLKSKGLGYLLNGFDFNQSEKQSNVTAQKDGLIQTKTFIMQSKQDSSKTPQEEVLKSSMATENPNVGLKQKSVTSVQAPTSGGSTGGGGGTY